MLTLTWQTLIREHSHSLQTGEIYQEPLSGLIILQKQVLDWNWKEMIGIQFYAPGFFYSCRRLTSSEATCYSCGRQVTDWSNGKTAAQAHRMVRFLESIKLCNNVSFYQATDHCPLYSDDKEISDSFENLQKNSVSCFAEFFFIAATLLFRIASVCLLLWVFMVSYSSISL